jgi:hypothetical protein
VYVLGDKNAFTASVFEITLYAVVYVEGALNQEASEQQMTVK